MRAGARSAATMAVLCGLLVLGGLWGWSAVTAPFPGKAAAPVCENRPVAKGDKIFPAQVVVSVYNAGSRFGLAGSTMELFTGQGFQAGDIADAPNKSKVPFVQIWTPDPKNPAVQLVASRRAGPHSIVKRDAPGAGVNVVVGDRFEKLGKGPRFVKARSASEICSPSLG